MADFEIKIALNFDWKSYEDDISEAVKCAILNEVAIEARKTAKVVRDAVAKELQRKHKKLIEKAIDSIKGE